MKGLTNEPRMEIRSSSWNLHGEMRELCRSKHLVYEGYELGRCRKIRVPQSHRDSVDDIAEGVLGSQARAFSTGLSGFSIRSYLVGIRRAR